MDADSFTDVLLIKVVDEASARINTFRESPRPIPANHMNMVKFLDKEDDQYIAIKLDISRCINDKSP